MSRLKLSREALFSLSLVLAMLALTALGLYQDIREPTIPLDSESTSPIGALALKRWVPQLGYTLDETRLTEFDVPAGTDMVLMLEPTEPVTDAEWDVVDAWVEDGGTLLVAGQEGMTPVVFDRYQVRQRVIFQSSSEWSPQSPLLLDPALEPTENELLLFGLTPNRDDVVTLVAVDGYPYAVTFRQGLGRVILVSSPTPFSNVGLQQTGNPELVHNLLKLGSAGGQIWFDEWHHGKRAVETESAIIGPADWLRATPIGQALLLASVILFVALLLRGRLFGRPVPMASELTRRAPLEYVTALANLNRRAGHREAIAKAYHAELKRGLASRYRLDPTMPDDAYVARLSSLNPTIDSQALERLLAKLSRANAPTESELVALAGEVADWLTGNDLGRDRVPVSSPDNQR